MRHARAPNLYGDLTHHPGDKFPEGGLRALRRARAIVFAVPDVHWVDSPMTRPIRLFLLPVGAY